jgi:hypothetical protein
LEFSENISNFSTDLGGIPFVPLTLTSLGIRFLRKCDDADKEVAIP